MSFIRTASGVLLLAIGIPILLAGGTLWMVAERRDAGGAFGGTVERLETAGHAVVVPDLDALLRRDAPFVRAGRSRLRITARTPDGPAFLGIAPAADAAGYLASSPYARVERISVTRGTLPVRTMTAAPSRPGGALAAPDSRTFWRQSGVGVLDIDPRRLRDGVWSLVVMRPDGAADVGVEVRAEVRLGWVDPTVWGLLAGGVLFVLLSVAVLIRPIRPREVVFVVEPDQVPVLAARLGVDTLNPADSVGRAAGADDLTVRPKVGVGVGVGVGAGVGPGGASSAWELPGPARVVSGGQGMLSAGHDVLSAERDVVSVGHGVVRPADLTDLLDDERRGVAGELGPEPVRRPVRSVPTPPAWPPPRTERPGPPARHALVTRPSPARPALTLPPSPAIAPPAPRSDAPVE